MYAFFQLLLISLGCLQAFAQQNVGTYTPQVTQDVALIDGSTNFNDLQYLVVGSKPLKRSLMKFENISSECSSLLEATLHIYFISTNTINVQASSLPRHIVAHTVLKSWSESQATSTRRNSLLNWDQQLLNLGTDASLLAYSSKTVQPVPGTTWYTFDVTQQTMDWKFGPNNGLLLRDNEESIQGHDFKFASNTYEDITKHAYKNMTCSVQ